MVVLLLTLDLFAYQGSVSLLIISLLSIGSSYFYLFYLLC